MRNQECVGHRLSAVTDPIQSPLLSPSVPLLLVRALASSDLPDRDFIGTTSSLLALDTTGAAWMREAKSTISQLQARHERREGEVDGISGYQEVGRPASRLIQPQSLGCEK